MKKIAIISHYGGLGGGTKSLMNLLCILSENYNVDLYIQNPQREVINIISKISNVEIIIINAIPVIPLYSGGPSTIFLKFYYHIFKSFLGISIFLKKFNEKKYNLVIVNSILLCWISYFFKYDTKKICFVRETKIKSIFNNIQEYLLKKFDAVVFLSNYDKFSWNIENCYVIENTLDKSSFSKCITNSLTLSQGDFTTEGVNLSSHKKKIKFLYMGGDAYIKGFYHLIFALIILKYKREFQLTILGKINRRFNKVLLSVLGRDSIVVCGLVSDISFYYQECDIVVFPVTVPHQGRPIIEAGYFSKPVIIPDMECFKEFVEDNLNGFCYKSKSVKGLINKMILCIDFPNVSFVAGLKNRQLFDKKHSDDLYLIKIHKLINFFIGD